MKQLLSSVSSLFQLSVLKAILDLRHFQQPESDLTVRLKLYIVAACTLFTKEKTKGIPLDITYIHIIHCKITTTKLVIFFLQNSIYR